MYLIIRILMIVTLFSLFLQETSFADSYREREEVLEKNDKMFELYKLSVQLIKKYEWFSEKAYFDQNRCSIWFWTKAKSCSEKIDYSTAENRLKEYIDPLIHEVMIDFPDLHTEWQSALVSFRYNCPKWYADVKKNGLSRHSLWCKKAWLKVLPWLMKRRAEESKMILNTQ